MEFIVSVFVPIIIAYFVYITQKIDKRQDRIEVDIALIKASFESREDYWHGKF